MAERMFGLETEYAFSVLKRGGVADKRPALQRLFDLMKLRVPNLPGLSSGGVFLSNGARFYLDCGHPELTTPEVTTPWEACRYILAGERILSRLAGEVTAGDATIDQVMISRLNVCYSGTGATFGCHESYGHRADPQSLPKNVIPHLASRIIFTGAGGFNNRSPGIEFTLSPRVSHLVQDVSTDSTSNRAIFHTKDEPLGPSGYHRMHIICGESLCSETANWLKLGTTALVVAMAEGGVNPGHSVYPRAPIEAMRIFAADPTCRAEAFLANGSCSSAIGIQRHFLQLAERHADATFMPPWTGEVCRRWRETLDRIEHGPAEVSRTLDWAIKFALYKDHARRFSISWDALSPLRLIVQDLREAQRKVDPQNKLGTLDVAIRDSGHPIAPDVARIMPKLHELALGLDAIPKYLRLRQELFELDTRFGALGEQGIFNSLDRAGVLAQRILGVDGIDEATTQAPAAGRARLRGKHILQLFGRPGSFACEWTGVWNHTERKFLDLTDPFTTEENWKPLPPPPTAALANSLPQVLALYNRGHYERAAEMLSIIGRSPLDSFGRSEWLRYSAWVQSRRGFLDGLGHLQTLTALQQPTLDSVTDYLCFYRFHGLGPKMGPDIDQWIKMGFEKWRAAGSPTSGTAATFLGHHGHILMRQGRLEEARDTLEKATSADFARFALARVHARNLADLGELRRRMGNLDLAVRALDEAETIQRTQQLDGDMTDLTFMTRAKMATDPQSIGNNLDKALTVQLTLRNRVGEARTRMLMARQLPGRHPAETHRARLAQLRTELPALTQCTYFARVLDRWTAWIAGEMASDVSDSFWNI